MNSFEGLLLGEFTWSLHFEMDDGMMVQPSDGPIIILIDCEQFSETVAQWLWLRAFQTVHYRITLKINSIFLHNFLQNSNYYSL